MRKIQQGGVSFLQFDLLLNCPEITHGSFLRHGGYSLPPFNSLNFSSTGGDNPNSVKANRELVRQALGLTTLVTGVQCHGTDYYLVKGDQDSAPPHDAMMTDLTDIGLLIKHADCQAALFYDPVRRVIANVHSGWRGAVQQIYSLTIQRLKSLYGTKPEDLLVCISPSLGPEDSEFLNYKTELPESFWSYQIRPYYFDFWTLAKDELVRGGVLPHHIEIASLSTYSHPQDFFSYRREKVTGRLGTIIGIKTKF